MKLFDYKFLILLGLTLVVYFIYREVLELKNKIKDLENKNNNSITDKNQDKKVLENKKSEPINYIPLPPKPVKRENNVDFQIPLPPPPQNTIMLEGSKVVDEDSENFIQDDNSAEHLAIYSNDNEKTNSYTLGESSELQLSEDEEDLDEDLDDDLEEDLDDEIQLDDEKKNILVESEGDNDIVGSSEKSRNGSINNLSVSELLKYKLNELQCFAEEVNVDIANNIKNKKKTKNELANDLFNYYQNPKNSLKF